MFPPRNKTGRVFPTLLKGLVGIVMVGLTGRLGLPIADKAFYQPSRSQPVFPLSTTYSIREERVPSGSGQVHCWIAEPGSAPPSTTVLFCHGNAGNLENHFPLVDFLPTRGYRVVLFDYRGYGSSSRLTPSRESTIEDVESVLDFVNQWYGKPVLMGHSLGASLALPVAARKKETLSGIIAVAPFTSYREAARSALGHPGPLTPLVWLLGFLVRRGFDPIDTVGEIAPLPLLFLHTEHDEIIPSRMSRMLHEKAGHPKQLVLLARGNHNSDWKELGEEYVGTVVSFLEETVRNGAQR